MNKYFKKIAALICICLLSMTTVLAQEEVSGEVNGQGGGDWPREIQVPEGVVVIYQPQPETLNGNLLKGRAAVAVEIKGAEDPVFGAIRM
jgi:hypothetical protein